MVAGSGESSICAAEVRRGDPERYLAVLCVPATRREDLFALYAFKLAVARTRDVVSEPLIGEMRLQWWRDAIAAIHEGRPTAQPVVEALGAAIRCHGLVHPSFEALIDARAFDLADEPPEDERVLESYAEACSAPLARLTLEILGASGSDAVCEAGRHVGIAWALTGLLRAVPAHGFAGRRYLVRAADVRASVAAIAAKARGPLAEGTGTPARGAAGGLAGAASGRAGRLLSSPPHPCRPRPLRGWDRDEWPRVPVAPDAIRGLRRILRDYAANWRVASSIM